MANIATEMEIVARHFAHVMLVQHFVILSPIPASRPTAPQFRHQLTSPHFRILPLTSLLWELIAQINVLADTLILPMSMIAFRDINTLPVPILPKPGCYEPAHDHGPLVWIILVALYTFTTAHGISSIILVDSYLELSRIGFQFALYLKFESLSSITVHLI
jgi:hypothetical protein